ncbi:MAG: TetR/AcrR family transcriptional regulator [Oscillospiraceae bacterium]|nr:TetR/AcrR family transcriptional regulator [Oscillospiraceae bacterium]
MQASYNDMPPKKQLIIGALHDLIAAGSSPESVTVSEIASKAGIGKGTIYEYFSCKEEIFREGVIATSVYHLKNMSGILESCEGYRETLAKMAEYILKIVNKNKVFFEFILKDFDSGNKYRFCEIRRDFISTYKDDISKLVNGLIQKGIDEGIISSMPERSKIEFASFSALSYLIYSRPDEPGLFGSVYSEDEIKNLSCEMYTKIIC